MSQQIIKVVTRKGTVGYVKSAFDKVPEFTPFRHEAFKYKRMSQCKEHRDHVLKYVKKADIERI